MTTIATVRTQTLSTAAIAIALLGLGLTGCSSPAPAPSAGPTGGIEGDPSAFEIEVGDCLNDKDSEGTVTSVPVVPCDEPHDSEAFASILIEGDDFPGEAAIVAQANKDCAEAFADFVGIDYDLSELAFTYYYPSAQSWEQGDREILCEVYDPESQTTGSLEAAKR